MVFFSSFRIKGINVKYWRVWMSYKIFVNSVTMNIYNIYTEVRVGQRIDFFLDFFFNRFF